MKKYGIKRTKSDIAMDTICVIFLTILFIITFYPFLVCIYSIYKRSYGYNERRTVAIASSIEFQCIRCYYER